MKKPKTTAMSILFPVIETFAPTIPLLTCIITKSFEKKWLYGLLIYFIVYMPLVGYANFSSETKNNNILLYVIITIITFISFSMVITFFIKNRKIIKVTYILIVVVVLFSICNILWWEKLDYFNSHTASLTGFILIGYCLYYYKQELTFPETTFIVRQSSFWIISGIFIYSAGNFFLFTFYHQLSIEDGRFSLYVWIVADCLILLMNIFFAKAILCSA